MNHFSLLLAARYLRGVSQERTISIMVKISFCGILIGTFALALTLFIMHGFEQVTHAKLQGIHAQLTMRAHGDPLNVTELKKVLTQEFPQIQAVSPTSTAQILLQTTDEEEANTVVLFKAIDPAQEAGVTDLENKITTALEGKTLPQSAYDDQVLIGEKLAHALCVIPGDVVTVYIPNSAQSGNKISFHEEDVVIGGIFNTGIDEFDSSLMVGSFDLFDHLFPEIGVTQLSLKLKPRTDEKTTITALHDRLHIEVYSWKELYPALVSALKLEKYVMFFILLLITLVASMSIVSLLFMQITHKRTDIAILKAMGMPDQAIQSVFLALGCGIGIAACLSGLLTAFLAGYLLQKYPFITLPDAYYVTHIPVAMDWFLGALVFAVALILTFAATWLPARRIKGISVAHVLRFES